MAHKDKDRRNKKPRRVKNREWNEPLDKTIEEQGKLPVQRDEPDEIYDEEVVDEDLINDEETLTDELLEKRAYRTVEESPMDTVLIDTDDDTIEPNPLDPETVEDSLEIGTYDEAVMDEISEYTDDESVLEDFAERQQSTAGEDELLQRLTDHNSRTPEVTGDDIDASWETADQSGEEAVGGTVAVPDQDVVEELGEAVGLEYEDDEELDTADKLRDRDINRWELNPESAEEQEEELEE